MYVDVVYMSLVDLTPTKVRNGTSKGKKMVINKGYTYHPSLLWECVKRIIPANDESERMTKVCLTLIEEKGSPELIQFVEDNADKILTMLPDSTTDDDGQIESSNMELLSKIKSLQ